MPSVPIPNTVMVELIYNFNTISFENVFHVKGNAPATAGDLDTIRAVFDNWHNTQQRVQMHGSTQLRLIKLTALDAPGSPFLEYPISPVRGGTLSGSQVPSNVAVVVKWNTGLTGRSYRGRTYHCGLVTSSTLNSQQITTAYQNALIAAYENLRTTLAAGAWKLVVASKYSGVDGNGRPIPRVTGIATLVTSATVDVRIDSQRRRLGPAPGA